MTYITHAVSTLFTWTSFTGVKGIFLLHHLLCVTSLKLRNHYIAANLTVVVLSAEDCCTSSMKLRVPKKVVLFIVYLSFSILYIIYMYMYVYSCLYMYMYIFTCYISIYNIYTYTYIYIYIYCVSECCLLQKLSSNYTFNKFTS